MEWALKNPNNQSRNVECYRLIRKWAKLDKNSPRFFIGKVEDHTLRSPLLLGYLSEAKDFDTGDYPEIADWMITIEGTPFIAKEGSFFPLFLSTWFDKDIPGGLNWIQKQKTSNENEAIFKGNVVASLLVGENPFTSGRFNKNTEPISATDSSQNIPSQLSSSQSEDVNPWFTNITEQKIRGDYAVIIWKAFLGALVLFGVWKTWVVLKTRDIPVPIKGALVFLNLFIFLSIIAGTDEAIISKHSILTQTTVLEASAGCFGILFIFSYYFLFSNQCAAGSRAMPIFGASLTILGIAGIVVAVFFKGDFAASIGVLVLGAIPLLASLPKRSRDFRKFSREKRKTVPRFLLISGAIVLGVFVFAVGGDVIKNIQQNPKFALQLALISPFGMAFYLGPIYWSLRWGDALGLRLYQFALLLVACFSAFCGFGFLKSGNPFSKSYLFFIGFLVFFIPFLLTFHRSVRKWSKELRPIF